MLGMSNVHQLNQDDRDAFVGIDREWLNLMKYARAIGLSVAEVREFIRTQQELCPSEREVKTTD